MSLISHIDKPKGTSTIEEDSQSFFREASYMTKQHTLEENSFLSSQAEQ